MGRRGYPAEFRRRVGALVESGRSVKELADDLGVSEQTIYTWRKQARIDAGHEAGLTTDERDKMKRLEARRGGQAVSPRAPTWSGPRRRCRGRPHRRRPREARRVIRAGTAPAADA